jgi:hypothetical protein
VAVSCDVTPWPPKFTTFGVTTIEVSDGELIQLVIGINTPVINKAPNKERLRIQNLLASPPSRLSFGLANP